MANKRIALAGAGNVATHLAAAFARAESIDLIYIGDRTAEHARALADEVGVAAAGSLGAISQLADLDVIVVSVADSGIEDVAAAIGPHVAEPLTVHTSGTVSKHVLEAVSPRTGILYPLQSFTAGVAADLGRVPFFIETAQAADYPLLEDLARSLSPRVYHADERLRGILHIAGVYTNNFVNVMLLEAERLLGREGLGLEVVEPLVRATVDKAFAIGPLAAQTGPARRGDSEVVRRQLERLPDDMKPVYETVSQLITDTFSKTKRE